MNRIDVRRWGSSYLNTVGMQNVGRDVKRKGPRYFNEDELRVEALKLFSRSLVEKGYGMKRPDLLKKNIIDFRGADPGLDAGGLSNLRAAAPARSGSGVQNVFDDS